MKKVWTPTPEDLEKITELVGKGVNQETVASAFGITGQTWYRKKKEFPEIEAAVQKGKCSCEELVVGKLWNMILDDKHKNHASAVFFWLKTQAGWREKDASNVVNNNYAAPTTNNLFRAVTPEDVAKAKSNDSD